MKKLADILARCHIVGLDTSILICQFEAHPKYAALTSQIFLKVAEGIDAVLSTFALTEFLLRPFAEGPKAAQLMVPRLMSMPNFRFLSPDASIAIDAARLGARHSLKAADALHLATSLSAQAEFFITNDREFKAIEGKEKTRILILEDFLA